MDLDLVNSLYMRVLKRCTCLLTGTDDAMDGVVAATGTQQKYSLHHPLSRDVDVLLCFLSEVLVTTWHFGCTVAVLSAQWLVEHVKNYI